MAIGMAVNSGNEAKKQKLAILLDQASLLAIDLGLWVEGKPYDLTLRTIANQLVPSTAPFSRFTDPAYLKAERSVARSERAIRKAVR